MNRITALLLVVLAATALRMGSSAHATPPYDASNWRDGLTATTMVPPACVDTLWRFLAPTGDEYQAPPGLVLDRSSLPAADPMVLARLNAQGGLPYYNFKGRLVRMPSVFDKEAQLWSPRKQSGEANRGIFSFEIAPGRRLIVFDHMPSPITSATSIWEERGHRVTMLAHFPGEIVTIEDQAERVVLHLYDTMTAVSVEWDKSAAAFVGTCLIHAEAAASFAEPYAEQIFSAKPVPSKLTGKSRPLYLVAPTPDLGELYAIGKVAPGTTFVALYKRPDGWVFALVPVKDGSQPAKLFRRPSNLTWTLGWLPPGSLPVP